MTEQIAKSYEIARERYAALGVDTEAAMEKLAGIPISLHCWQGDDVLGFEDPERGLSGGITQREAEGMIRLLPDEEPFFSDLSSFSNRPGPPGSALVGQQSPFSVANSNGLQDDVRMSNPLAYFNRLDLV